MSVKEKKTDRLRPVFYPRSVAIVGASPERDNRAKNFLEAIIGANFRGRLFPIHPKAQNVLGLQAYPTVRDVPEEVEYVIISIPAHAVPDVMRDCVAKRVKVVHIFTAGFSETGDPERAALEAEIGRIAKEGGVRVIGPNCMGVYCPESGLSFNGLPKTPGPVGLVSQSGQLANQIVREGSLVGLRFSKVVSFGNAIDVGFLELMEYLEEDESTEIIAAYLEGLADGRQFVQTLRRITRSKPVIIWKGGQTEGGARAVASHTASLVGSYDMWRVAYKQAGVIGADTLEELIATLTAFRFIDSAQGRRLAVLGGAGGGSVTMSDVCERMGLSVPLLSAETQKVFSEFTPIAGQSVRNPLDIGHAFRNPENVGTILKLLDSEPNIDAMLLFQNVSFMRFRRWFRETMEKVFEVLLETKKELKKPMLAVLSRASAEAEMLREDVQTRFIRAGIPVFSTVEHAAKALDNLIRYQEYRAKLEGTELPPEAPVG